jgi:DNA-binding HxlR family transcriptional regulator
MAKTSSLRARALQSREAIELVSDKWRITILHVLAPGPLRTGQLQRAIKEVSQKMLTQTLRRMERDGLISRKIYPVVPPRVEYQLSEMGGSLIAPLRDLCHWAEAHVKERDRARHEFDARERNSG